MNLEFNKIFAALLIAGIAASGSSFVARKIIHPHDLEQDAVPVAGVEVVSGGAPKKPKGPDPILHLIAEADIVRGEKLSKACAACHSFDKGGPARTGPNLWNTTGAAKAHSASFAYSDALTGMGGVWGYTELNNFLFKPKNYISGTKMNYNGMKKPEDRAAIIAWLRTMSDSPLALPSEAEIAAEQAALAPPEPEETTEDGSENEAAPTAAEDESAATTDTSDHDAAPEEEADTAHH